MNPPHVRVGGSSSIVFLHHLVGFLVTHFLRPENRNSLPVVAAFYVENRPDHRPPLGVELTGFHLLGFVTVLAFGIWRVVLSYYDDWVTVVVTRVELIVFTVVALVYAFIS